MVKINMNKPLITMRKSLVNDTEEMTQNIIGINNIIAGIQNLSSLNVVVMFNSTTFNTLVRQYNAETHTTRTRNGDCLMSLTSSTGSSTIQAMFFYRIDESIVDSVWRWEISRLVRPVNVIRQHRHIDNSNGLRIQTTTSNNTLEWRYQ